MNKPFTVELLTKEFGPEFAGLADRLNQIVSEQSGWVKCSDRLPTKEDADEWGRVLFWSDYFMRSFSKPYHHKGSDKIAFTHWRKIVKPEN